jgi:protein SCO1
MKKNIIILALLTLTTTSYLLFNYNKTKNVQIGGDFKLTDHNNNEFIFSNSAKKISLVFFGFTRCPSSCPTALSLMTNTLNKLDNSTNQKITPIFVSVDPEHDTTAIIAKYKENYHKNIIGLTGTITDIDKIKKNYKLYVSKTKSNPDEKYMINHSSYIYLMDNKLNYITHIDALDENADNLAKLINQHI